MKRLYIFAAAFVLLLTACSKKAYYPVENDGRDWMSTHEHGVVAYVDPYTGNYIVETNEGFSVVELWGGIEPREYDEEYAYFSNTGIQTIYNYHGDFFTKGRIVDYWLTWSEALYVIDDLSGR